MRMLEDNMILSLKLSKFYASLDDREEVHKIK
jgi:hypothetical protein